MSLAAGAMLAALAPAAPAQAQAFGQNLFSRIFGSGDDEAPAINYSERAPIVIPPKRDMRQPADPTALAQDPAEHVNREGLKYINRVSDFLFVAARAVNDNGNADVLWVPGKNR